VDETGGDGDAVACEVIQRAEKNLIAEVTPGVVGKGDGMALGNEAIVDFCERQSGK
jgi:hypothetical protein